MVSSVQVTNNFVENLEIINHFLQENDAEVAFDDLILHLDSIIDNLELFPEMGNNFFIKTSRSSVVNAKKRLIQNRLADLVLREYIFDDYIILYAMSTDKKNVYLLSIKHHRQLSYDFKDLWIE